MSLLAHRGILMGAAGTPPVVLDVTTYTTGTTATTTHAVQMPASVAAGALLIMRVSGPGTAPSTPSGWTLLSNVTTGGVSSFIAFYKIASGTEGGTTVTLTTASARIVAVVHMIQAGTYSGTPERVTAVDATTSAPNPPSITPSWGSANTLFFAEYGARASNTISTWPYVNGHTQISTGANTTNDRYIATCWATVLTATEDPPAYALTGTTNGGTLLGTIAVQPA